MARSAAGSASSVKRTIWTASNIESNAPDRYSRPGVFLSADEFCCQDVGAGVLAVRKWKTVMPSVLSMHGGIRNHLAQVNISKACGAALQSGSMFVLLRNAEKDS